MTVTGTMVSAPGGAAREKATLRLRILATSDLHAHLFPYNYYADRRDDSVGLARLVPLIEQARAECPNTILVDNGDTLQGAPLADAALADLRLREDIHPMVAAMNAMGYDAATLGNHDFDFGLPVLEHVRVGARYPFVLSNVRRVSDDAPLVAPHAMLERTVIDDAGALRSLRIGVTGATPPQVMRWARAHLEGQLTVEPILPAVRREVALLRAKGADVVIVLAHSGLGSEAGNPGDENVGRMLARLAGVDAVVAGHTHRVFASPDAAPHPDGPAALVQPGFWGSHLGLIDLDLALDPETTGQAPCWQVRAARASLRALDEPPTAEAAARLRRLRRMPALRQQMARSHRLTRAYSARAIGQSAVAFETYFSLLAPCAATQLIADAQRAAVAEMIADRADLACLPLISAATPFKAGGRGGPCHYTDVPAGALLLRHAADLYTYSNGLALLRATGAQIREWLERCAAAFQTIVPTATGAPQPLIDQNFASYNFDRLDGLRYDIDLSQRARTNAEGDELRNGPGRIRNLRRADGQPVSDDDLFLVVTSTYRAGGGGHFPAAAACETVLTTTNPLRNSLISHISAASEPLAPVIEPSFRLAPLGGTQVLVLTGPGAADHADRAKALGLVSDGIDATGFARYLLRI